jgi:hypothetical protein
MLPHGGREMNCTMRGGVEERRQHEPSWRRTIRQEGGGGGQLEASGRQTTGRHTKRVEVYGIVDGSSGRIGSSGGSWSLEVN